METIVMDQGMLVSGIILAASFILIFTETLHGFHRVKVAMAGAAVMLVVGQSYGFYSPEQAFEAVDWNVVFLLGSMMAVVAIMINSGGFEVLAANIGKIAKGRQFMLLALLGTAVTVISLLLDNVTTVVIFGPLIVLICQKMKVSAIPYLMAAALLSDTGGVATLVGDPPNLMIGSDGIDGVSRKFVVGSNSYIKKKKIFRTVSFEESTYNLSKTILQVLIHENGYYVIYPAILNKKKATNYIFVPQNNETELPTLNNKIVNYLIPEDLEWQITYASFNDGEKTSIYKNGLFLFGDAAFAIPPHTAQAGNQILEDAAYIKKLLNANYDFYEIVSMFVKERYLKKDMLAKKSKMVGEILNAQNIVKYFRDYSLKLNGNDLLEKILSPIWTTESYE